MTLREQLVSRMFMLLVAHKAHVKPAAMKTVCGVLADECIRQMEWARQEAHYAWKQPFGHQEQPANEARAALLLTLAPEDWKP